MNRSRYSNDIPLSCTVEDWTGLQNVEERVVADDIQVHYYPERGELFLSCDTEAFSRLCDLVVAASGVADDLGNNKPRYVQFVDASIGISPSASWIRDRLALFGCSFVGFLVMFVFVIGVMSIIGWFQ